MPSSPSSSFSPPSLSIPSHTAATSPLPSSPSIGTSSQEVNANGNANAVATHGLPLPPPSAPISSACAACKYQRRKCGPQCMLAPYFPPERQQEFQNAHRLFGVSNIVKKLRTLSPAQRQMAVNSMVFEANAHAIDPAGGCCKIIQKLHKDLHELQTQLSAVRAHLAFYRGEPCNLETNPHEQPYADQERSRFVSLEDVNSSIKLRNQAQEQRLYDYVLFEENQTESKNNINTDIGRHDMTCNYVNNNHNYPKEEHQEQDQDEIRPFMDIIPICSDNEEGEEQLVCKNSVDMASLNSALDASAQCSLGLGFSSF